MSSGTENQSKTQCLAGTPHNWAVMGDNLACLRCLLIIDPVAAGHLHSRLLAEEEAAVKAMSIAGSADPPPEPEKVDPLAAQQRPDPPRKGRARVKKVAER